MQVIGSTATYHKLVLLVVIIFSCTCIVSIPYAYATTTISWDSTSHNPSDGGVGTSTSKPKFTVTDTSLASNGKSNEKITVQVNSTSDHTGITLTLTETGDTGKFDGHVIFSHGRGEFDISSSQTVGIKDSSQNKDSNAVETIISGPDASYGMYIVSTSDAGSGLSAFPLTGGTFMNLTETGKNTGVFENTLHFTTGSSVNGSSIKVKGGDVVTIANLGAQAHTDLDAQNELVTPNPDPSFGVVNAVYGDHVDVVYNGVKSETTLNGGSSPGGGGGGLINPSVVIDAIVGVGRNSDVYNPPSIGNDYRYNFDGGITINGKPFDIHNYSTTIPQQVIKIGEPASFGFKIYDERGAYTISHVGMYFHFKGDPAVTNADTWIAWDKNQGIVLYDPNKIFSNDTVGISIRGSFLYANFTLVPQKTMPDSSLIMRMWDDKLALGDVPIWGAIVIVDPNAPVPVKKIPSNQYGDYETLKQILDNDGYHIPNFLAQRQNMASVYSSLDINWVYDKKLDKLTMVESDKAGNVLGTVVIPLSKKATQPSVTDHDYFSFSHTRLNRQDVMQESWAKIMEAQKATKVLQDMGLVRQSNFEN